MTTHIKSINRKVWKVVETKIEIEDLKNSTTAEEVFLQNNDIALSDIHYAIDERTFEQIKNIVMAHEAWRKLEESFEDTKAIKGAKAYILMKKFASFKMKEDESVPDMFHWMECWHFLAQSPSEEVLSPFLATAPEMPVGIS
jgi:hypothetical protein